MVEDSDPWADLAQAASATLRRVDDGDVSAAKHALRGVAVGLRDLLSGRLPDPERRVYLDFLLRAIEQIDRNVDLRKALGLWGSKRVPEDRDFWLFMRVGSELDSLKARSSEVERPVARAVQIVSKRFGLGESAVEKAWKSYGGEDGWKAATSQDL